MFFYHHIFDDEKLGFERQLKYIKNFGEFISIDDLASMVQGNEPIDGRYFCLSFDDGFQNNYTNALDITVPLNIPGIIYIPTDYIDKTTFTPEDEAKIDPSLPKSPKTVSFLSWAECREMIKHNFTFGSHTKSHTILSTLSQNQIEHELVESKKIIEKNLGVPCHHFAPPRGHIGIDFDPEITVDLVKRIGFKTMAVTNRGKIMKGENLYLLKRDQMLAGWDNYQVKYFFGK